MEGPATHPLLPPYRRGEKKGGGGSRAGRALWLRGVADQMRNALYIRRELGGCQSPHVYQVCCGETPQSSAS